MSSVPIHLPLKASEAAALADVISQFADQRSITDELRAQLSEPIRNLGLASVVPFLGSLQTDPAHPGTYYLAVDSTLMPETVSLLLRVSLSTTPGGPFFPDSVVIGRMRPGGAREVSVDAIPFGSGDHRNILTFTDHVNPAFLPTPMGARPAITVIHSDAARTAEIAFQAFQQINREFGMNLAAHTGPLTTVAWAAIRTGWRLGYALESATRVVVDASQLDRIHWNGDVEMSLRTEAEATTPNDIAVLAEQLRQGGHMPHFIAPKLGGASLEALAVAAHECNVVLSLYESEVAAPQLRGLGGVNYKIAAEGADLKDRILSAARILKA